MSDAAAPDDPSQMQGTGREGGSGTGGAALAALAFHAGRAPEEPALFHPEGFDVHWRSWGALAEQVAGGAAAIRDVAGAGAKIALAWRCHPDAVAAWLAARSAGAIPVAVVAEDGSPEGGCSARLLQPGETAPAAGLATVRLPEARSWARGSASGLSGAGTLPEPGPRDRQLAAIEPLAARIGRAVADADAAGRSLRPGDREIVLAHLDPRRPGDEGFLAWVLVTGAALFLEPDPRTVPASAVWARPTLVAAEAGPLAGLARRLRERDEQVSPWARLVRRLRPRARPVRRPFGRLRLLVVLGAGRLPIDDLPYWAGRGVSVLRAVPDDSPRPG